MHPLLQVYGQSYERNLSDLPQDELFALILSYLCQDIYRYHRYINPALIKIHKLFVTELSSPGFGGEQDITFINHTFTINTDRHFNESKGLFIWEKTPRLQPGQPSASVMWDDFNFRLHEKFHPGLQWWLCHAVLFWV